jgi:transglutaminase-like putative cysteine protease
MWRKAFFISLAGLAVLALSQLWLAVPSTEAVRLRNAFLIERGVASDFAWKPADRPRDFRWESRAPPPAFTERARSILGGERRGFEGALLIAKDLLRNAHDRGPIQSDLENTYRRITEDGYGYCADFTDVFLALAHAAGIPARQWAFSFDGFGGHGHAFVEVFDAARGSWLMIDLYNNFYPVTVPGGAPMTALDFRSILLDGAPVRMQRISDARLGFPIEAKALDYYRRGAPEWYLWWGNDVFTYEQQPLIRAASMFGRSAEQLAAVATDTYPHFRVVDSTGNAASIERMARLRQLLLLNLAMGAALLALAIVSGVMWYRHARGAP